MAELHSCYLSSPFEKSPLPPALSAKELARGRTQLLNVCWISHIDRHPAESDENGAPESISDMENWLHWNCDLDRTNGSEDDCAVDNDSNVELDICFEDPECSEQWDVCAAPNVPGLIRPRGRSKKQTGKVSVTVNATDIRSIGGNRKCRAEWDKMCLAGSLCCLTENFT